MMKSELGVFENEAIGRKKELKKGRSMKEKKEMCRARSGRQEDKMRDVSLRGPQEKDDVTPPRG